MPRSLLEVNPTHPINPTSPLNRGKFGWWMGLPHSGQHGSKFVRNLAIQKGGYQAGTAIGTPWTATPYGVGLYGMGTNYFQLSGFSPNGLQEFTIEVTFYPVTWPGAYTPLFDSVGRDFSLFFDTNGAASYSQWSGYVGAGPNIAMPAGTWYHFVATRSATVALTYYVNGVNAGTSAAGAGPGSGNPWVFGANVSGGTNHPNIIYQSVVYREYCLTEAEVRDSYRQTLARWSDNGQQTSALNFVKPRTMVSVLAGGVGLYDWSLYGKRKRKMLYPQNIFRKTTNVLVTSTQTVQQLVPVVSKAKVVERLRERVKRQPLFIPGQNTTTQVPVVIDRTRRISQIEKRMIRSTVPIPQPQITQYVPIPQRRVIILSPKVHRPVRSLVQVIANITYPLVINSVRAVR